MKGVVINKTGDVSVLTYEEQLEKPTITSDQILVRLQFAGINYIDTYFRSGLYPIQNFPKILGQDGAGIVEEIGSNVVNHSDIKVGDRVALYGGSGTYAEYAVCNPQTVVKIPENISLEDATAAMVQGMTAHYLIHDAYKAKPSDSILVHAAAGGTGRFIVQMLKAEGVKTIIGTVGSPEKAEIAKQLGCTHVIEYEKEDIVSKVKEFTNNQGVNAVYDGVGKNTFQASLNSLAVRGTFVSFGNASGAIPSVNPLDLSTRGSITFIRPRLNDYTRTIEETNKRANDLFDLISKGLINVNIHKVYSLKEAKEAHLEIEGRKTLGKILLKIE
ncbi:hypothetical protein ABK040_009519 [Willaertia magna]